METHVFLVSWEHVLMLIILTPIIIISIVLGLWSEHNLMVYSSYLKTVAHTQLKIVC